MEEGWGGRGAGKAKISGQIGEGEGRVRRRMGMRGRFGKNSTTDMAGGRPEGREDGRGYDMAKIAPQIWEGVGQRERRGNPCSKNFLGFCRDYVLRSGISFELFSQHWDVIPKYLETFQIFSRHGDNIIK